MVKNYFLNPFSFYKSLYAYPCHIIKLKSYDDVVENLKRGQKMKCVYIKLKLRTLVRVLNGSEQSFFTLKKEKED
jgi:hypothetical protein